MKRYIIGIDEGTTSARAGVFDTKTNKIVSLSQKAISLIYPKLGWVEIDAKEIWSVQRSVLIEAVSNADIEPEEIFGIGLTNQRETVVAWDRQTGKPISNAICWQCRRTAKDIEKLSAENKKMIKEKTGLIPDAYFSATKMKWILENVPEAKLLLKQHRLCMGTIDSYIVFRLTKGVFVTDTTNASRTMLFNINTLSWDADLLKLFKIPLEVLPQVVGSNEIVGTTNLFGKQIPICGIAGDQQSALIGQACYSPGMLKNTYGTGGFLLVNTGNKPVPAKKLLTTVAYTINGKTNYALEGSVFNCGSTVQWIRDGLGIIKKSADTEKMALSVDDNAGVYLVPAFTGLGSPYWDMNARGTIVGLTRASNKNHIARAALEAMAYSTEDLIKEMKNENVIVTEMRVDGGVSNNKFLMQFQSDLSNVVINVPTNAELTLMGAVYLAGLASGAYGSLTEIADLWRMQTQYLPKHTKTYDKQYLFWKKAVERSLNWEEN